MKKTLSIITFSTVVLFGVTTMAQAVVSVGDAVDNLSLTWETGGNVSWFGQTTTVHYGGDAAESGNIANDQTSYMQTTVTGPGTVSFYWKISSEENYDFLRFYIDDVEQSGRISGSTNWALKTFNFSSGSHTLKWAYSKDFSFSWGSDCGWIDQVVIRLSAVTSPSPFPWSMFLPAIINADDGFNSNGYRDNGDGTVTDRATGLMWQQIGRASWRERVSSPL